ncbi:MAG: hypothetical protein KAR42_08310 [candidate division Zixibacteria bacterium]|nr:hypothetical protein [candidate division Zixibacteria bacterium]
MKISALKVCCMIVILASVSSCTETIKEIETDSFIIEQHYTFNYMNIDNYNKANGKEYEILSVEIDNKIYYDLLDDSIIVATDVQENLGFMTNLQDTSLQELHLTPGDSPILEKTTELSNTIDEDWTADLFQRNGRPDMYIIAVQVSHDDKWDTPSVKLAITGARRVEIISVKEGNLHIEVYWQNSKLGQPPHCFNIAYPENTILTPSSFSVVPL